MNTRNKSYLELIQYDNFEDRFNYLKLNGRVGENLSSQSIRWLKQIFYRSPEWRKIRDSVIIRDNGCDLGIVGREIGGPIYIHHINPITNENIRNRDACIFDLNNLISVSFLTHQAIHYSDDHLLMKDPVERKPNDTCPWRK